MNFNHLELTAQKCLDDGEVDRAISIYAWMATGDPSLDGGYLGERLGECYERLNQPFVARFWYTRAVEENPEVCVAARAALGRLDQLDITEFVSTQANIAYEN